MIAAGLNVRQRMLPLAEVATRLEGQSHNAWLSATECEMLATLRAPQRRAAWLGGRYLAKTLILEAVTEENNTHAARAAQSLSCADICIVSRDSQQRAIRPLVFVKGKLKPWTLSITHSACSVSAALVLEPDVRLGIDLTETEGVCRRLAKAWFTDVEWTWLHEALAGATGNVRTASMAEHVASIWAVKEAAYKALNEGESFAPRRIEVLPVCAGRWRATWYLKHEIRYCQVRTEVADGCVRACAAVDWAA